jgi:hypothetical protein
MIFELILAVEQLKEPVPDGARLRLLSGPPKLCKLFLILHDRKFDLCQFGLLDLFRLHGTHSLIHSQSDRGPARFKVAPGLTVRPTGWEDAPAFEQTYPASPRSVVSEKVPITCVNELRLNLPSEPCPTVLIGTNRLTVWPCPSKTFPGSHSKNLRQYAESTSLAGDVEAGA